MNQINSDKRIVVWMHSSGHPEPGIEIRQHQNAKATSSGTGIGAYNPLRHGKKETKSELLGSSQKSAGKKKPDPRLSNVAENRKARHRYEILDSVECGMMLMGSEVKSMREGKLSLDEAYIRVKDNELWLIGADIAHYNNAGMWNHDPRRPRKLLVHAREFDKFAGRAHERGLTLVPLARVFQRSWNREVRDGAGQRKETARQTGIAQETRHRPRLAASDEAKMTLGIESQRLGEEFCSTRRRKADGA